MSAIHAEEIIFELLETVIDQAAYPLTLNKLEGDAVFLYAEMTDENQVAVARDVARQAQKFFTAFYDRARELSVERADCACDACQRVHDLRLKGFLHSGEAVFRTVRQFEELAGEDVITIHRLLKNSIPAREYILMTESFHHLAKNVSGTVHIIREERYDDLGKLTVHVFHPKPDEVKKNFIAPIYYQNF
jgi:hypothetical protein